MANETPVGEVLEFIKQGLSNEEITKQLEVKGFNLQQISDAINQAKIKEIIANYETEMEKNVTSRWTADMNSDSRLSKNVRPLVLIFLVVCTMLLIFIDAGKLNFNVKDSYVDLLQLVLITVIGAYFGGRSLEKVKK